jgi:hypothetical protein
MPEEQTDWTIIPCPARFVDRASGRTLMEVTLEKGEGAGAQVRLFGDDGREVLLLTQDACGMTAYGGPDRNGPHADLLAGNTGASVSAETPDGARAMLEALGDEASAETESGNRKAELHALPDGAVLMLGAQANRAKGHGGSIEMWAYDADAGARVEGPSGCSAGLDAKADRAVVAVQGKDRFVHALAAIEGEESGLLNVDLQPLDPREGVPTGLVWHPDKEPGMMPAA